MKFFVEKRRTKYIILCLFILVSIQQVVSWVIRYTYVLYEYNGCYYTMFGDYYCKQKNTPPNICPGPTASECDWAKYIKDLFFVSLLCPALVVAWVTVGQLKYCWCPWVLSSSTYYMLKCNQVLWTTGYFISSILYLVTAGNIEDFSDRGVVINEQVLASCYILTIISILIVGTLMMFNYDLFLYYNEQEMNLILQQDEKENKELKQNIQNIVKNVYLIEQMEQELEALQRTEQVPLNLQTHQQTNLQYTQIIQQTQIIIRNESQ